MRKHRNTMTKEIRFWVDEPSDMNRVAHRFSIHRRQYDLTQWIRRIYCCEILSFAYTPKLLNPFGWFWCARDRFLFNVNRAQSSIVFSSRLMHSCDRKVSKRRIEAKEMRRDCVLECDQSNPTVNGRKHSLRATDIALTLQAHTATGSH